MDDIHKKVQITGINNRYYVNKLIKEKKNTQRVITNKWNMPSEYFHYGKQLEILNILKQNENITEKERILKQELERKIYSYKQQDILKNILNEDNFIKLNDIIEKLLECQIKCYYCNCEMCILYETVREGKQWTVDRINNDLGHNTDNIVIACLECNLKRRNQSKDNFLFTKQLKIIKEN
jgi:hypothetical protein